MKTLTCDVCNAKIEIGTGAVLDLRTLALSAQPSISFDLCPKCALKARNHLRTFVTNLRAGE